MRRIALLMLSTTLIVGCAGYAAKNESLWVLLERAGQSQPMLSAYDQGKRYLTLGNFGLAIDAFQRELGQNPNSVPALNGLAVSYDRLGRADAAQQYLDRALALDPNSTVTLSNLAYLNLSHGNKAVALAYAEHAKSTVSNASEMQLSPSVSNAVSANIENINILAAPDTKATVATEEASAANVGSIVEQVGLNEWQLRIPPPTASDSMEISSQPPSARAGASDSRDWAALVPSTTFLRISNGTGRPLMAKRFADYLSQHGLSVRGLANAPTYSYAQSAIYYNPDQREAAEKLAKSLPLSLRLIEAKRSLGRIEIILGSDLLAFDDSLRGRNAVG
jgi:Tfp pilus assembly protein PilF